MWSSRGLFQLHIFRLSNSDFNLDNQRDFGIYQSVVRYYNERRALERSVQYRWIFMCCKQAPKEAYPYQNPDEFCLYQGWFPNFCHRNWISIHIPTNVGQKLLKFYQCIVINWTRFNHSNWRPEYHQLPPNCEI